MQGQQHCFLIRCLTRVPQSSPIDRSESAVQRWAQGPALSRAKASGSIAAISSTEISLIQLHREPKLMPSQPPFIELRTDAFTQPTQEMTDLVRSMGYVYSDLARECPQTDELEALGAEMMGMEASVLCPSGTLSNLLGLMTLGRPGSEVIVETDAHVYNRERGGISAIAQLVPRAVRGKNGVMTPEDVEPYIR